MTLKGTRQGNVLTVQSRPHWIWTILAGIILGILLYYLFGQMYSYRFSVRQYDDLALMSGTLFFLFVFFILAFLRPGRLTVLDLRLRQLNRDITTVAGDIDIRVPLETVMKVDVVELRNDTKTGFGIQMKLENEKEFLVAIDLPFLEAELLRERVSACALSVKYPKSARPY